MAARLIALLVIIWLVIGALAAYQRDYFADEDGVALADTEWPEDR